MSELEDIRPDRQRRVMDLVKEAGLSVADWKKFRGGAKRAATNPKYCYEWCFVEDGKPLVLSLWFRSMTDSGGTIRYQLNPYQLAKRLGNPASRGRALRMDEALKLARKENLPLRVIVCEGRMRETGDPQSGKSRVQKRRLDPVSWRIETYDESTRRCVVVRESSSRVSTTVGSRLVECSSEIRRNVSCLDRYCKSGDAEVQRFFRGLLQHGNCFITCTIQGVSIFGPSRFLGYANNSVTEHNKNRSKDGKETNPVLERILGEPFLKNTELEARFQKFCGTFGVIADNRPRKYINIGPLSDEDLLIDDLQDIGAQASISDTERKRLIDARIGQGDFRDALLRIWKYCHLTGCRDIALLRASHIQPWRVSSNVERLDPYNGLLLTPNIDIAFDRGLVTFQRDGSIAISRQLCESDANGLGIAATLRLPLKPQNQPYLEYHRKHVFRS